MDHLTKEILNLLKASTDFVSSNEICQQYEISRVSVWKHINKLKDLGYQIESIPRRGYQLQQSTGAPVPEELRPLLSSSLIGSDIQYVEAISSTNRVLMTEASQRPAGSLIIAETQTAGHGRMSRKWHSPSKENLYFSFLLKPEIEPYRAPQLAILSALAIYEAVIKLFPEIDMGIKWPNDIYINRKKAAGILCEMQTDMVTISHVVIGIGLNVNSQQFAPELAEIATSISLATGQRENRCQILAEIINTFDELYKIWLMAGLEPFLEKLNRYSIQQDRKIEIEVANKPRTGIVRGVDKNGFLLLENESGQIEQIPSGEVHINKNFLTQLD